MSFDAPQSRNEAILQNILGAENVLVPAQSEIEAILLAILNDTSYSLEGRSRIARLLIAIKNNGTWDELPCISRNEEILYCILNGEAYQGETYSRNEELLKQWSESHATYEKTVSGNPIHVTDAVEESALALSVAFEPTQAGTPFVGETTTEPYLSKTATTIGNKRYLDKMVGGTVAWNQLEPLDASKYTKTNIALSLSNGEYTFTPTTSTSAPKYAGMGLTVGHVYFVSGKIGSSSNTTYARAGIINTNGTNIISIEGRGEYTSGTFIRKVATNELFALRANNGTPTTESGYAKDLQIIDLTLMFGSTIADYIYSLEQAEAGAGVQWLKDYGFIDDTYRAYNAGQLISTRPEGIQTVGFNKWNEVWEVGDMTASGVNTPGSNNIRSKDYIPVFPNTQYYLHIGSDVNMRYYFYDENKTCINNRGGYKYADGKNTITTPPDNARYIRFKMFQAYGTTYKNDICINISDPAKNGTYEPYEEHTTTFGSPVELRGLYKLDASNKLHCYGDELTPDGTLTANYDYRAYQSGDEELTDAITDGTNTVVKKVTPTTSSSETYPNPVNISNGDTESFIDTRSIPLPVGNNSHYAGEYAVQGKTGLTVKHAQTQEHTHNVYIVTFAEQGTVYGGTVDIVSGALSITWGYIASYNGETLTGRWMSSLDEYAEGTTPTTGAQVAYELASPITAQLTPQQVEMLLGENTVWTDDASDSISLTYIGTNPAVRLLAGLRKNSNNAKMVKLLKGGLKDAEIIRK